VLVGLRTLVADRDRPLKEALVASRPPVIEYAAAEPVGCACQSWLPPGS
jgi:hypothetical protein